MKVRVKAEQGCWYNKQRKQKGDVVEFYGDKLPSWAEPLVQDEIKTVEIKEVELEKKEVEEQGLVLSTENKQTGEYPHLSYRELLALAKDKGFKYEKTPKREEVENFLQKTAG